MIEKAIITIVEGLLLGGLKGSSTMKKIIITIFLCASFAMATWDGSTIQPQQSMRNGKKYYLISTPQELAWFAEFVNDGNANANAVLTKNIVINESATSNSLSWIPIGSEESHAFDGIFDGDDFTIQGIYSKGKIAGLFGYIGTNGMVSNLKITSSLIVAENSGFGGGVAAVNQGSISDCVVEASLGETETQVYAIFRDYLEYAKNISFKDFNDRMNASGPAFLGGIVGSNTGTISYCEFNGTNDEAVFSMGGIVGEMEDGIVSHCINRGNITVKGDFEKAIKDNRSSSTVSITYSIKFHAGGIAAEVSGMSARIENSINYGNIMIDNKTSFAGMDGYVGGIVGYAPHGMVSRSVNKGDVTILMSIVGDVAMLFAGGVVGYAQDSLVNNANWGNVVASMQPVFANSDCQAYVGGITPNTKKVFNSFSAASELSSDCYSRYIYATAMNATTDMRLYYNNNGTYGEPGKAIGKPLNIFSSRAFADTLNAKAPSVWKYIDGTVSPVEPGKDVQSSSSQGYSSSSNSVSSSSHVGSETFISKVIPQIKVQSESRRIYVSGTHKGTPYAVFDMQGQVVVNGSVSATNIVVPVPRQGSYVLVIGNAKRIVCVK